jgi:HK97 family phage portal protein
LKLTIRERFKAFATGTIEDHRVAFIRGDDIGDEEFNADRAMKYSAVSACIRVRAETFASVPMILYRKKDDGRETVTDETIYDVFHNCPNSEMAPFGFKETMMTNFDLGGNIVCERLLNKKGELIGLYPYRYCDVRIDRNKETKNLEYQINGASGKTLRRDQVLHVPNLSYDGITGMSPISYAASAIKLGLSYEQYGVNFYRNAAMPSGVFEHPQVISDAAYDRLKKDLKETYTGLRNSGVPMLLEEGMKWNQITINPIDAQLLESKQFQIEDICRIYRVPQHLVNKLDRSTFNNIEHLSLEFVMYTMLPIFKRFEDNINSQILTPEQRKQGMYMEAKIDGLLRGDAKSRAEAYAVGRQWGWLSVNDIRRLENMPTIANGDRYLEPLNFAEAGAQKDDAAAKNYAKLLDEIGNMIEGRR